jgi:hypothetical protein
VAAEPLELRELLSALTAAQVELVVIGGVAVAAHGYVRATADLDVVPAPSPENAERLADALVSVDATLPLADDRPFSRAQDLIALKRRANLTLDTRHGGLDVVQRAAGVPSHATLDESAVESDLLGLRVRVCSLSDLRRMKEAQGRPQDLADLANLPEP